MRTVSTYYFIINQFFFVDNKMSLEAKKPECGFASQVFGSKFDSIMTRQDSAKPDTEKL